MIIFPNSTPTLSEFNPWITLRSSYFQRLFRNQKIEKHHQNLIIYWNHDELSYLKDLEKQGDLRDCFFLLTVTPLWHVAQWVSRAPPHHTLPAFRNLNGIFSYKSPERLKNRQKRIYWEYNKKYSNNNSFWDCPEIN